MGTCVATDVQNTAPWVYKWSVSNDFSTVAFAPPNTVRNCVFCHQGGAQSDNWKTKPSRAACGSCHDDINWATGQSTTGGKPHAAGPQQDDKSCKTCHPADDRLDWIAALYPGQPDGRTLLPFKRLFILTRV